MFKCAPVSSDDKIHIAEKPLAVMNWLLDVIEPSAVIVDPFMGSGTTLAAAKNRGMKAIGIERDEHACENAAQRCSQETLFPA